MKQNFILLSTIKRYFICILSFLVLTSVFSLKAEEENTNIEWEENYIAIFIGSAKAYNEHIDSEGFANREKPGSSVGYGDNGFIGGLLLGKKLKLHDLPLRIEIDGTFGDILSSSNKLDPVSLDETVETDMDWIVTARLGIEQDFKPVTVFANGGLAAARISNSVTDIDFSRDRPPQRERDPDDSFQDDSIHFGWVVGMGFEVPLAGARISKNEEGWVLRIDASYADFGKKTYYVNHSGNNICGPRGPRRPCSYKIKNRVGIVRLVLSHPFSL